MNRKSLRNFVMLLFSAILLSTPSTAADKRLTLKTTGNHTSISFKLMKRGNFGYIAYSLGKAGAAANRIVLQRIKWVEKKNAWRLSGKPKDVKTTSSVAASDNTIEQVLNPAIHLDEDGRFRGDLTFSDIGFGNTSYNIRYATFNKQGNQTGDTDVLRSDTRQMFNGIIVPTLAGPLATHTILPNAPAQTDAGLVGTFVGPNPPIPDLTILFPGEVAFDPDRNSNVALSTFAVDSITGTQCNDGFAENEVVIAVNRLIPGLGPFGNQLTQGGYGEFQIDPDGTISRDDSFFFFSPSNIETIVKVLDATNLEGFNSFWVFAAATTDVEYNLTVTDTQSGEIQTYSNPLGQPSQAVLDTNAFVTCPAPPNGPAANEEFKAFAVAYNKKKGRFFAQEISPDGMSLIGKKFKSKKIGKSVARWALQYKNDHLLILYIDGLKTTNRLRLYDMDLTNK